MKTTLVMETITEAGYCKMSLPASSIMALSFEETPRKVFRARRIRWAMQVVA